MRRLIMVDYKNRIDEIGSELTSSIIRLGEYEAGDVSALDSLVMNIAKINRASRVLLGEIILKQTNIENNECGVSR